MSKHRFRNAINKAVHPIKTLKAIEKKVEGKVFKKINSTPPEEVGAFETVNNPDNNPIMEQEQDAYVPPVDTDEAPEGGQGDAPENFYTGESEFWSGFSLHRSPAKKEAKLRRKDAKTAIKQAKATAKITRANAKQTKADAKLTASQGGADTSAGAQIKDALGGLTSNPDAPDAPKPNYLLYGGIAVGIVIVVIVLVLVFKKKAA